MNTVLGANPRKPCSQLTHRNCALSAHWNAPSETLSSLQEGGEKQKRIIILYIYMIKIKIIKMNNTTRETLTIDHTDAMFDKPRQMRQRQHDNSNSPPLFCWQSASEPHAVTNKNLKRFEITLLLFLKPRSKQTVTWTLPCITTFRGRKGKRQDRKALRGSHRQ